MAGWDKIARANLNAAQSLNSGGGRSSPEESARSVVSRSYYAAFSAVTYALQGHVVYPQGRETPGHGKVPFLMQKHLKQHFADHRLRDLKAAVRRLYTARLDADYRSVISPGGLVGRDALRASKVLKEMGVPE
ncbi:MAG: hypothetical protein AMXMBFR13_42980 [Phycisphaerae bacterium]